MWLHKECTHTGRGNSTTTTSICHPPIDAHWCMLIDNNNSKNKWKDRHNTVDIHVLLLVWMTKNISGKSVGFGYILCLCVCRLWILIKRCVLSKSINIINQWNNRKSYVLAVTLNHSIILKLKWWIIIVIQQN